MKYIVCLALCALEAAAATVTVDSTKTRAPISKYIYGQFIEHLGRCIYGGTWAEMLEDRKFFYPVTGEAPAWEMFTPPNSSYEGAGHSFELLVRSPWMIAGPKQGVRMVKDGAWVGEHTPEIALPGKGAPAGLMQERLTLVAGREYVGRVVLSGGESAGPVYVSLVWGGGATMRQTVAIAKIAAPYATYPLRFKAGGATDNGRLEIVARGSGSFRIGTASLMPADNIRGWRADTVALLKELNSPVYRWPGGNFVSGYNWRDGIGNPDKRPPRKNPAWKGIEHNDVGIHEYMALMREIGAEPFVAINTGLGDENAAAEEVEYLNGSAATREGDARARNGHPQPYGVKFFAVGNEMYGNWQLGHMPLSEYVKKHNRVVDAMRKVYPGIEPIGVGAVGQWSEQMLTQCANHMSLISEHIYWQDKPGVVEHVAQVPAAIRKVADAHRDYRRRLSSLAGKNIRISLDEWNFWYGPNDFGELGTRYFLRDGLGIAAGLHEYFRNSDIFFMANYAQTVNVIGAIKTTPAAAEFEATGLALKLYRERFGVTPVEVAGAPAPLDVVAAWNAGNTALTLGVVNPAGEPQSFTLAVNGAQLLGDGMVWVLTGPGPQAHNNPGEPRTVDIRHEPYRLADGELRVPPLSASVFVLPAGRTGR